MADRQGGPTTLGTRHRGHRPRSAPLDGQKYSDPAGERGIERGDLPQPKWLRYAPNTDHKQSLDVAVSLASWIDQINDGITTPHYSWSIEPDGAIRVEAWTRPNRVRLWQATNRTARDIRLEAVGTIWTSTDLLPSGQWIYRAYVPPPPQGWTAYLVELTYEESGLLEPNQVFTTDVVVTPDTLPFANIRPPSSVPRSVLDDKSVYDK